MNISSNLLEIPGLTIPFTYSITFDFNEICLIFIQVVWQVTKAEYVLILKCYIQVGKLLQLSVMYVLQSYTDITDLQFNVKLRTFTLQTIPGCLSLHFERWRHIFIL